MFISMQITKYYSVVSNFDEVMPYWARSSSEFLHFTRRRKNCDICATVGPISAKFNTMAQNVFWSTALKISILKLQDGEQQPSWKSKNCNIWWWYRTGLSNVTAVRHLGFLKWIFNGRHTRDARSTWACQILWRSIVLLQRYRNLSRFLVRCKMH